VGADERDRPPACQAGELLRGGHRHEERLGHAEHGDADPQRSAHPNAGDAKRCVSSSAGDHDVGRDHDTLMAAPIATDAPSKGVAKLKWLVVAAQHLTDDREPLDANMASTTQPAARTATRASARPAGRARAATAA
jgi:hypothetical protein